MLEQAQDLRPALLAQLHYVPECVLGYCNMARAVLEELTRRMAGMVRDLAPQRPGPFLAAGGGSRQRVWMGMLGEALGRPIRVTSAGPLLGAARMAAQATIGVK